MLRKKLNEGAGGKALREMKEEKERMELDKAAVEDALKEKEEHCSRLVKMMFKDANPSAVPTVTEAPPTQKQRKYVVLLSDYYQ